MAKAFTAMEFIMRTRLCTAVFLSTFAATLSCLAWVRDPGVRAMAAEELAVAVGQGSDGRPGDKIHYYECNFAAGMNCNSGCVPFLEGFATCEKDFAVGICDKKNILKDCMVLTGDCGWMMLCEDDCCVECQIYPYPCDLVNSCQTVP